MTDTARANLTALARKIGGGFHPDTRGDDYVSLPEGVTAEEVDRVVDEAIEAGIDPYEVALEVLSEAPIHASPDVAEYVAVAHDVPLETVKPAPSTCERCGKPIEWDSADQAWNAGGSYGLVCEWGEDEDGADSLPHAPRA